MHSSDVRDIWKQAVIVDGILKLSLNIVFFYVFDRNICIHLHIFLSMSMHFLPFFCGE